MGTAVRQAVRKIASPPCSEWVLPVALGPGPGLAIGRLQQVILVLTRSGAAGLDCYMAYCAGGWWNACAHGLGKGASDDEAKRFPPVIVKGSATVPALALGHRLAVVCWALAFKYAQADRRCPALCGRDGCLPGASEHRASGCHRFAWVPFAGFTGSPGCAGGHCSQHEGERTGPSQASGPVGLCSTRGHLRPGRRWCARLRAQLRQLRLLVWRTGLCHPRLRGRRRSIVGRMEQVKPAGGGVMTAGGVRGGCDRHRGGPARPNE